MTLRILVITGAIAALPVAAAAQTAPATDHRWAAWLGCWDLQTEDRSQGGRDPVDAASREPSSSAPGVPARVCVTPGGTRDAVQLRTIVNGTTILDETVSGNGVDQAISEDACHGTRAAEWSLDGRLLFTRGTLACDGQPTRTVSGLMMLVPGPTWVDVQLLSVANLRSIRVRRYALSSGEVRADSHAGLSFVVPALVERLTFDEVKEASRKVDAEVLQATMVEVGSAFPLDTATLLDLRRAAVPDSVVDLMVALTYPDEFEIQQVPLPSYGPSPWVWYDPWALPRPMGGYGWYAPFGYQYLGYYHPYYGRGWGRGWESRRVRVIRVGPSRPPARVVNDRGYMRVPPPSGATSPRGSTGRVAVPVDRTGSASGTSATSSTSGASGSSGPATVSPSGYSRGGTSSSPSASRPSSSGSSAGSSSGSSSSAGRSSGGSSPGGGSSSSGRTAKPRPPGR